MQNISGVGIGLRDTHIQEIIQNQPDIPWLEILTDNVLFDEGLMRERIVLLSKKYPMTLHGVGLSLGGSKPLSTEYLEKLKILINQINPGFISEHLSWSYHSQFYPDLLPLPRIHAVIQHFVERIKTVQNFLGRKILVENVSSYIEFKNSVIHEADFMNEIAAQSDCGILLDINNIYVSSYNHGWDAQEYIYKIDSQKVQEFHLAGHVREANLLIDTHSKPISDPVWELYQIACKKIGFKPTLIEWDNDIPPLSVLLEQKTKAENFHVCTV